MSCADRDGRACRDRCPGRPRSKQPAPGEVYKEYVQVISVGNDDWRVTDPNIDLGVYPQAAPFLPNPTLSISIDDLAGATQGRGSVFGLGRTHRHIGKESILQRE